MKYFFSKIILTSYFTINSRSYRALLNELLQSKCRMSIPLNYSSRPNYVVCLSIGSCSWYSSATGDYIASKEEVAQHAYEKLEGLAENQLRSLLDLPDRRSVVEVDEIRDVVKKLKNRIRTEHALEEQCRLMKKVVAIYNVIDDLERCMHK